MFIIAVYCPQEHLEKIKEAMFKAGAGKIGNYDACSFEYSGLGQFRGGETANPFLGQKGLIEKVAEIKVEMVCEERYLRAVLKSMKEAHPYEEPAYHVLKNYSHLFED